MALQHLLGEVGSQLKVQVLGGDLVGPGVGVWVACLGLLLEKIY